jgi:hypothetical protein
VAKTDNVIKSPIDESAINCISPLLNGERISIINKDYFDIFFDLVGFLTVFTFAGPDLLNVSLA